MGTGPGKWWLNHPYQRRSVSQVDGFAGWKAISDLAEKAEATGDGQASEQRRALIEVLFEGGWRVSEVCRSTLHDDFVSGLKRENIKEDGSFLKFDRVAILKKFERLQQYQVKTMKNDKVWWVTKYRKTKRVDIANMQRTILVPLSDRFAPHILDYVSTPSKSEYLFPFSRQRAYKLITAVGPTATDPKTGKVLELGWFPHRFRAERAIQLAVEEKWNSLQLMKWFSWATEDQAAHYASFNVEEQKKWFRSAG